MFTDSEHISLEYFRSSGTFAVVCLMTGKVASDRMTEYMAAAANSTSTNETYLDVDMIPEDEASKAMMIEIATAISLAVGLWQARVP